MNCDNGRSAENWESRLAELVQDPLIGLMMKSDGIERSSIEALFAQLAQKRRKTTTGC